MKGLMRGILIAVVAGTVGLPTYYGRAEAADTKTDTAEFKIEQKTRSCFSCADIGRSWKTFFLEEFRRGTPVPEGYDKVTLAQLKKNPRFYASRRVQFPLYYGGRGDVYQPYLSPFTSDTHVNFSGWAYGTQLWDKAERADVFPFLYVDRQHELVPELDKLPRYAPIMVFGEVVQVSAGQPWINVKDFRRIKESAHSEASLRHVELGIKRIERENDHLLAAQAFEAALQEGLPAASEAKIYALLGKSYVQLRRYPEAKRALESAVSRDPENPELLMLLSRTYVRLNDPDSARKAAEEAVRLQPSNAMAHADLGIALALCGQPREGLKECTTGLKLNPKLPEALFNRARIYRQMKRLDEAIEDLIQAILLRPNEMEFHLELGDIELVEMKRIEKALDEYLSLIHI